MTKNESENEDLAALQARSHERDELEGQIVFKGDYESSSEEER